MGKRLHYACPCSLAVYRLVSVGKPTCTKPVNLQLRPPPTLIMNILFYEGSVSRGWVHINPPVRTSVTEIAQWPVSEVTHSVTGIVIRVPTRDTLG